MRVPAALVPLLILAIASASFGLDISGSLKTEVSLSRIPGTDPTTCFLVQSPMRVMIRERLGRTYFDLAYTLVPTAGDPALGGFPGGFSPYRIDDLRQRLLPSDWNGDGSFSILQNLDRFSVRTSLPFVSLTAGRQAVFWGVCRGISPTDFLAPFQYGPIDTEYRVGIDCIRLKVPAGMMSELDAGWAMGRDALPDASSIWLRGRFYLLQTDLTLLASRFRENLLLGGSLNRALGEATGWVECAFVSTGEFREGADPQEYWSGTAGWQRSWFQAQLSGFVEYHFNSAGKAEREMYEDSSAAYSQGTVYLLGRHYLTLGANWIPHPLLSVGGSAMLSMADGSAYLSLSGEYSVSQNVAASAGIQSGTGDRLDGDDAINSDEFSRWPLTGYLRLGWYF